MSTYRQGTVLGLTVAEVFILLTFLLLIALLGLIQRDKPTPESDTTITPKVWKPPEQIETLVRLSELVRKAEHERDLAREEAEQARKARAIAEHESELARNDVERAHVAQEKAEKALANAEHERGLARNDAERARAEQEEAEQALTYAKQEREQALSTLEILRRKGENPPCWYKVVNDEDGKPREKPYYAFNVAIYKESIELAPRTAPLGGAIDDGGGTYADEWKRLRIDEFPYGKALREEEFEKVVSNLVAQGKNRMVRTYECVFSVMVWDKTPANAKARWKRVHDKIIEGSFSAYTTQNLEWKSDDLRVCCNP